MYPQRADFTFYGGLYRQARLLVVPEAHLRLDDHGGPGLTVTPVLEAGSAVVSLEAGASGAEGAMVRLSIDGVGSTTAVVAGGTARATLRIEEVRRWHGRRDPFLYTARAELLDDAGAVMDDVALRFGCREMGVDPDRGFLLNGEPYPLRGVSRHQDWAGVGNVLTDEMMETDLGLLLEIGATTVRLAHYQHAQRFYDLCDVAGIVVWAEIPLITDFMPGGVANARSQLTELIVQSRHHASIACWGLSNEITVTGNGPEVIAAHRELNDLAHRLDPTRLTTMANVFMMPTDDPLVGVPDVMSYNLYYGWYVGELEDNDRWFEDFRAAHPGVPVGLSEYGADANPAFQSSVPERGEYTEQYQALYHEHMVGLIERSPFLWATHVWNLCDFAADGRDEGGKRGQNQKGLVTFDRALRKDAFYVYKAAWSEEPFVHVAGRRYVNRAEEVTEVVVYSNQARIDLEVDGAPFASLEGRRAFRFRVPITGEHRITARSGGLEDEILVRRVAEPDPSYVMPSGVLTNWFDEDVAVDPSRYSIQDTLADIKSTPEGAAIVARFMEGLVAHRGDVARDVELPAAMQAMLDRMSMEKLLSQAGDVVTPEQVRELNEALSRIVKQS